MTNVTRPKQKESGRMSWKKYPVFILSALVGATIASLASGRSFPDSAEIATVVIGGLAGCALGWGVRKAWLRTRGR
ncbi:hypothetical protein ACYF6T_43950 [Streptomyces sp. 7R007]